MNAVKRYILTDTTGFAPAIGKIVALIAKAQEPETLTGMEAWALVSKAIKNGIYGAEKEFANLPADVQKAVGSPAQLTGWATTRSDEVQTVGQSNFLRAYKTVLARKEEHSKLPASMRTQLESKSQEGVENG